MSIRTYATLCVALSTLCPALAQSAPQPASSPSPDPALTEIGRVVTSDRRDEPLGATSKTTYVVTKADILRRGFTTVAAALDDVPGIVVTRSGPIGSSATVAVRGTGPNRTLVLLDGRPLAGAQIGTLDLGALPTAGVERIEIVEGSGATLYGTGAIGGVINIVTSPRNRRDTIATLSSGTFGERAFVVDAPNFAFERRVRAAASRIRRTAAIRPACGTTSTWPQPRCAARTATHLGALGVALDAGVVARHLGVPGPAAFTTPNARQDDVDADARVDLAHHLARRDHARPRRHAGVGGVPRSDRGGELHRYSVRVLERRGARAGLAAQRRAERRRRARVRYRPRARQRPHRRRRRKTAGASASRRPRSTRRTRCA